MGKFPSGRASCLILRRSVKYEVYALFTLENSVKLQVLLNSNSDRNSHTNHGVVACAQEAHHLHVPVPL